MATFGQGSLSRNNRVQSGAPFAQNSAYNGVSVDAVNGRVVLGDGGSGLADLVDNRIIGLQGKSIVFVQSPGMEFYISGDWAGAPGLTLESDINANPNVPAILLIDKVDPQQGGIISHEVADGYVQLGYTTSVGTGMIAVKVSRGRVVIGGLGGPLPANTGALLQVTGPISTDDPGNGAGVWSLGKEISAPVAFDNTRYVEVMIDGNPVRLAVVT
jgi:hypothetical protein